MLHFHLLECYREGSGQAQDANDLIKFSVVPVWITWRVSVCWVVPFPVWTCGSRNDADPHGQGCPRQHRDRDNVRAASSKPSTERELGGQERKCVFTGGSFILFHQLIKSVLVRGIRAAAWPCRGSSAEPQWWWTAWVPQCSHPLWCSLCMEHHSDARGG